MALNNQLEIHNSALYLKDLDICVVSDLHIGLEDELRRQGISFPLHEEQELTKRLKQVIDRFEPETVVLNGDILHSFGKIWSEVSNKLDKVLKNCQNCVLIEGSHDKMLPTLLEKKEKELHEQVVIDNVAILHGDKERQLKNIESIVIGHEHPAIEIEGEKLDCFLIDRSNTQPDLVLTPSFSPLTEGVSINKMKKDDFMSPYMKNRDLNSFEVLVEVDNETLRFPEIGRFRNML
ncbi:metallophosphoesterase [Methanonatronarchaeum sp. AMET-Sl]|uniref:metallophosphoesterase n=1 Tax=Methanonatronarchaeum sp. AMET-Sl TaxID=3037654 RepID=UPI00244E3B13|nr:metallophosphoesterase [Methanonatronarchaeum sp. AMET-Sl]WGI17789.1 metallophosphoesterase [Methanonatronarchaeum sp. AMET-Sl]